MDGDGEADLIQIRVAKAAQLFSTLDPSPFRERDLDPDAEHYIADWADELPKTAPLRIVVHLPAAEAEGEGAAAIAGAVRLHFQRGAAEAGRQLKALFRLGRQALLFSLLVLAACLIATQALSGHLGDGPFASFLEEGLVILGWVALWRPLEMFLYDWWPLAQRRRLYTRIADAALTIRADGSAGEVG